MNEAAGIFGWLTVAAAWAAVFMSAGSLWWQWRTKQREAPRLELELLSFSLGVLQSWRDDIDRVRFYLRFYCRNLGSELTYLIQIQLLCDGDILDDIRYLATASDRRERGSVPGHSGRTFNIGVNREMPGELPRHLKVLVFAGHSKKPAASMNLHLELQDSDTLRIGGVTSLIGNETLVREAVQATFGDQAISKTPR